MKDKTFRTIVAITLLLLNLSCFHNYWKYQELQNSLKQMEQLNISILELNSEILRVITELIHEYGQSRGVCEIQ